MPDRNAVGRAQTRVRARWRDVQRNRFVGIPLAVQRRYSADRARFLAATITYNAFLSVFPLLLLAFSLIGFVLTDPAERARWLERLAGSIPGLRSVLGDSLDSLVAHRAAAGIVGLASLAWTGTNVVRAAGSALNTVFELPEHSGWKSQLWALGTLSTLGALMLVSVGASGTIGSIGHGNPVMLVLAAVIGLALDFGLFLVSYRLLTHRRGPRFGALWAGALFAAIGWTALKAVGVWYATQTMRNATAVYGTFATTVGLLVMLSLGARSFLYGAELNAVLVERARGASVRKAISLARAREMRRRASG